jgi:NADH-quinone oxidoreductase subunit C
VTLVLQTQKVAQQIAERFPDAVVEVSKSAIVVKRESLFQVAQFLKDTPGLDFDYLTSITGVDYLNYLETVYLLTSMKHNHSLVLKARCYDRENPVVPSVVSLWRGADFQEREIYDLMGISFSGHPNMKRIFLWDGFQGYPLRRDYL